MAHLEQDLPPMLVAWAAIGLACVVVIGVRKRRRRLRREGLGVISAQWIAQHRAEG